MSFPKYPKYKPSGVEWLGDVPEHWEIQRIKHVIRSVEQGWSPQCENDPVQSDDQWGVLKVGCVNYGKFSPDENKALPKELQPEPALSIRKGDLLISRANTVELVGSAAVAEEDYPNLMLCDKLYRLRLDEQRVLPEFLCHFLTCEVAREPIELGASGASSSMKNIAQSVILEMWFTSPNINEQGLIASFLDTETSKIDALIVEQRRLIELLKEKRQAVISHAVTKGLNPNAPMKPSGIEWLGDVPEHWDIGRVKHYFQTCSGGTPNTAMQSLYYTDEENGIPWVRTTDLSNDFLKSVPVFITEQALNDTACAVLPSGTVMVAMYGGDGTVGKNGLLSVPAAINQAVCGLLPNESHRQEFTFRYIQFYRPYWMIGAESSRKDPNISQERVRNAPIPTPPLPEQDEIIEFLNKKLGEFDGLVREAEYAIDLLEERRTALISAAVTGKIDVREFANVEAA